VKPAQHPTALRVQALLHDKGLDAQVVEFEQPTRTSAEAAAAIGCTVAEIAKSVVFRGKESGMAVVVVASGTNRVCDSAVPTQTMCARRPATPLAGCRRSGMQNR